MTLSYIPSDTNDEGILKATASGVLPSGQPVVVNADGTVSVVASSAASFGSEGTFVSAQIAFPGATYDTNTNKYVVAYADGTNNLGYGTAAVGTVSGTNISFGTPVVFNSANIQYTSVVFDSNSNKVVIAYKDDGNSEYGTAIVGTVSGTGISFGNEAVFRSGGTAMIGSAFDSTNNKVVLAYRGASSAGTAVVGTVSGTSISFGSQTVFDSSIAQYSRVAYDSSSGKVVISYQGGSDIGTAIVGTLSGTSISFGTAATFTTNGIDQSSSVYDSVSGKTVIFYRHGANSDYGTAVVATVNGTSISFGTPVVFNSAATYPNAVSNGSGSLTVMYYDGGDSNNLNSVTGTVSGTSISFGSEVSSDVALANTNLGVAYDPDTNQVITGYRKSGNVGNAIVLSPFSTNLTAENYIGMSSGVVVQTGSAGVIGSEVVFNSGNSKHISSTFDSNLNKVIISYADLGNSNYGTAVVGTVSGTSISFGTPVVFESATTTNIGSTFDSNSNKVVIVYRDLGNSYYGTAIIGTVSGTGISFGNPVVYETSSSQYNSATFDSNSNKVVIAYRDGQDSNIGKAVVGTVSGTGISFGSIVVYNNAVTSYSVITFDSSSNKVVIAYQDGGTNKGTAVVGTVSGTNISFGSEVAFTDNDASRVSIAYDSDEEKVVVAYRDEDNSNVGTAVVGTVSNTSISFGTPVVFNNGATLQIASDYDATAKRTVIAMYDLGVTQNGVVLSGAISGTSISFSSPAAFNVGETENNTVVYDSNAGKMVLAYRDTPNNNGAGTGRVFQPNTLVTTRGQVPSGTQATTNIIGSVSSNQNALTAGQSYFVQTDGTIGTTAADPSVFAGTAISATKLIVKT